MITNFKEVREYIKLVSAWMHRKFLFQQNDTKFNNVDEGIFILEPFFWGNVIFKICFFYIKSHDWGREEFLWVASPDCNTAKLCNECFSLFMLSSFFKARADTLPGGAKQWKFAVRQLWLLRQKWQIFKMTLPQKHGNRIKTPSSKLMILVSFCWEKNSYASMHTTFFIFSPRFLEIIDRKCCILSGPSCINEQWTTCTYVW